MRKPSGDLHIVDYKTRRVIATIQPEDYTEDLRHWEIKNSVDILDFKVLESSPYAVYLQQQNLVLKEVRSGVIVPYVITEIEKDSASHLITVYASGEWTLLDKDSYFVPQRIESWTAKQYLDFATARTEWLVGNIEAKGTRTHTIKEFTSPLKLIHDVSTLFDNTETQYRVIIQGGEITKKYIDLVEKRGRETGKEVTLGKDLLGVKRVENSENIITALVPYVMGQDEDGKEKLITIESVNNGLQYIVDEDAYQRWNVNGKHLFGFYTPETEDQDMTPQRLLTLAKTELRKRVQTIVTYEVDAVDASRVFGLEHEQINEGDTINIIDEGMHPTLYLEARAIAGDESHKDPRQNKYTFGNYREIVNQDDALRRMYQKMLTMVQDKVSKEWFDALEEKVTETNNKVDTAVKESQAAKDLAEATQEYMEKNLVDIIESATPPTDNLKDGKTLWSDSSVPNNKVLKLWKGGAWIIISPDTKPLNTALTQAQNDITKAKQDITTNKGLLDTAKSEIQGNINTEKQRITDLTTTVGKKVDKTWIDQQLLDKADKSGVYTKDYIDQNTVGKQVYETDKAGNVQKFTDMSTDITHNANAIKSKAEQSSLDTTNNNVTGVTNRVTTVEQTATGLTTRIGSAESKINTATGDISSLKTKTNTIEQTANGSAQKITELTGQFTQKTNEIINTVETNAQKLTAVETTVKNAKYGRDNLIPNSGMFSNTGGWIPNTPANSTMEVVTEDGFNVMKIKGSIRASNPITLKPDTEYVYSALIKIPVDNVVSDGSGNPLHFWSTIGANPHTAVQRAILEPTSKKVLANTWTRVSYKFRTLAGAENTLFTPFMYSTELINSNAFFYVRYFQLIEGNQITEDWQAPSGDIVKKTNEIVQTVDSTISRVSAVENRRTGSDNLVKANSDKMVVAPKNLGNDADNYNYVGVPVTMQMDRTYTISARVKFTAGTDRHITVYPYTNGVSTHVEIKDGFIFHTFKKINVNTTQILLYSGKAGTTRSKGVEFTEIMVTEGDGVVAYAPPSPTIDEYTQKTTAIEQTATGLQSSITATTNRVTAVEGRTGTLETKSNTLRSDVDGNTTDISSLREDVKSNGENLFADSSCNNEYPKFFDDTGYIINGATHVFWEDYIKLTCTSYADAFYQVGGSLITATHGILPNETLTLSLELMQNVAGGQTLIFQHDGTNWSEAEVKTHTNTGWKRVEHTFKVKANMKGIMVRIRFPRVAEANTKSLWIRQLKLERGSLATPWGMSSVEILKKNNTIKQTTDENSATLTSMNASGMVGANMVYNADMLQRPTNGYPDGWAVSNITNIVWQNPWADEPRGAVFRFNRTNLADTDPNNIVNAYSNKFPVARNKDYTWSVWMYVPVANWTAFKVKNAFVMEYYDNAGTRVQYQDVGLTTDEQNSLKAGNWTRITRTYRPTTAGIVTGAFRLALFHNGDIYYRMPQVEIGAVATGWNRSTVDFAGNYQFEDLNTRSNTMKQTLDGTVSSVNSISQTVGQHTTQITQQDTTITQMNNEIGLRVKTTEMTDYMDSLGNTNELRNSAFEDRVIHPTTGIVTSRTPSISKWNTWTNGVATASFVADSSRNHAGYNSAKIEVTSQPANKSVSLYQGIPILPNSGDYIFSAWFYTDSVAGLDGGAYMEISFYNGGTWVSSKAVQLVPIMTNGAWKFVSATLPAPASTITAVRGNVTINRNGKLWVSQPMLQQGKYPSSFLENSNDYANYEQLVREVAKKVATTDYNTKITTIESSITQANNAINLRVLSTDVYKKTEADGRFGSKAIVDTHESSITLLKNQIISKVEAGGIASAINQTAQAVLIQAGKIMLDGYVEAKHLKANKLVGITIETEAENFSGAKLTLNKSDLTVYRNNVARGYFGFLDRTDRYYQPLLQVGGGWKKDVNSSIAESIMISTIEDYSGAGNLGVIGLAKSMSGNDITYYHSITMNPINKTLTVNSEGDSRYTTTDGDLFIKAVSSRSGYGDISLDSQNHIINTVWGGKEIKFKDGSSEFASFVKSSSYDSDLKLGHLKFRVSNHADYSGYGVQVMYGAGMGNLYGATIRAKDNMYATNFLPNSTRAIKTNITELPFSALQKLNSICIKEYNFIRDVEEFNAGFIEYVPKKYGMIAEETDGIFTTKSKDAVSLYDIASITVAAVQEVDWKVANVTFDVGMLKQELEAQKLREVTQDERIAALEELVQKMINGAQTTENTTLTEQL
ncbi:MULTISPECIES: phage tail spike protein [Bacillus cereus group]|uniref:phage tail spike protein n=1 Tax=Bacillus cereus group TaxID=86661 RepID=UPI001F2E4468|nr:MULTISPECIES: phage tail spike protein [Bacillus cereus group]